MRLTVEEATRLDESFPDDSLRGEIKKIRRGFSDFDSFVLNEVPDTPQRITALLKMAEARDLCEQSCFERMRRQI